MEMNNAVFEKNIKLQTDIETKYRKMLDDVRGEITDFQK